MVSQQKTPVAALRQVLGLNVKDFGKLIGKSISTVTKLENGTLELSEETAHTISKETGVDMRWLLAGKSKERPYFTSVEEGKQPYNKEIFDRVQARKQKPNPHPLDPALYLTVSDIASNPWHLVYAHSEKSGNGQLALYLYRQFVDGLVERLGADKEEFLRINRDARRTYADGSVWAFASAKELELKELGDVVLTRVGGTVPTPKPRWKPAIEIPCQDVPHDSDGNMDYASADSKKGALEKNL